LINPICHVIVVRVNHVNELLLRIEQGDAMAADELLPLVYEELRRLAKAMLAHERPGQTLQATALVHEAYLRLVNHTGAHCWDNSRHFFAAAAEAMRRILIERYRQKKTQKRGGSLERKPLLDLDLPPDLPLEEFLAVNEALDRLADEHPAAAELVKLHVFAGLSIAEAAQAIGQSRSAAYRTWTFARAWLIAALDPEGDYGP
jgi:RNA polymerase sigma factor (TIGR02999 family)